MSLPTDPKLRKAIPICTGVLDYFPAALAEVAKVSKAGNDQHNPGQDLHWSRGKSADHADTAVRHIMERGTLDTDGTRHSAKAAWRVLALLQEELEAAGAEMSRGSRIAQRKTESVYDAIADQRPEWVEHPSRGPDMLLGSGDSLTGGDLARRAHETIDTWFDPTDLPLKINNCGDPMCARCYPVNADQATSSESPDDSRRPSSASPLLKPQAG
jgi:hypothetical protein